MRLMRTLGAGCEIWYPRLKKLCWKVLPTTREGETRSSWIRMLLCRPASQAQTEIFKLSELMASPRTSLRVVTQLHSMRSITISTWCTSAKNPFLRKLKQCVKISRAYRLRWKLCKQKTINSNLNWRCTRATSKVMQDWSSTYRCCKMKSNIWLRLTMPKARESMIFKAKGVGRQLNLNLEPGRPQRARLKELLANRRYGLTLRGVEVDFWETAVSWSTRQFMPRTVPSRNESRRRIENTHRWARRQGCQSIARSRRHTRTPLKIMQASVRTLARLNCLCVLITVEWSARHLGPQPGQETARRPKITKENTTAQCSLIHCPRRPCSIREG